MKYLVPSEGFIYFSCPKCNKVDLVVEILKSNIEEEKIVECTVCKLLFMVIPHEVYSLIKEDLKCT